MLRVEPTLKMIEQWNKTFQEYKDILKPNRKTGQELVEFLKSKYELEQIQNKKFSDLMCKTVLENDIYKEKLSKDNPPKPICFMIKNDLICIDLNSGTFQVEDNENLWDELFAYRGLDEIDLKNYYLVFEYISCLKKFNKLENVLKEME